MLSLSIAQTQHNTANLLLRMQLTYHEAYAPLPLQDETSDVDVVEEDTHTQNCGRLVM